MDAVTKQALRYLGMYDMVLKSGNEISPRGIACKEIEDLQLEINPSVPFISFAKRNYPVSYFKEEMKWKLGANKYDKSIQKHAKMWLSVINPDDTYNSNYGQYWFGEQMGIWNVVLELIRDQDSRKAVIPMLNVSHMSPQTIDTVCTECIGFRLRPYKGTTKLNCSVHMRSSDIIHGLGTDVPTFSFLYRLVYGLLLPHIFGLIIGSITITAMSSHLYSHHYKMVSDILDGGVREYDRVEMPWCESKDAMGIIASRGKVDLLKKYGQLGDWLSC